MSTPTPHNKYPVYVKTRSSIDGNTAMYERVLASVRQMQIDCLINGGGGSGLQALRCVNLKKQTTECRAQSLVAKSFIGVDTQAELELHVQEHGMLSLLFRAPESKLQEVHLVAEYTKIEINGRVYVNRPLPTTFRKPYKIDLPVESGDIVLIKVAQRLFCHPLQTFRMLVVQQNLADKFVSEQAVELACKLRRAAKWDLLLRGCWLVRLFPFRGGRILNQLDENRLMLSNGMDALLSEIESLKQQLAESGNKLAMLEKEQAENNAKWPILEKKLQEIQNTAAVSSQELSYIKPAVFDTKGNVSVVKQELSYIKPAVFDTKGNVSAVKQELSYIKAAVFDTKGNVSAVKQELSYIKPAVFDTKGTIPELRQVLAKVNNNVLVTKQELAYTKQFCLNAQSANALIKQQVGYVKQIGINTQSAVSKLTQTLNKRTDHTDHLLYTAYNEFGLGSYLLKMGRFQPKVITRLDGGIGSQIWQFALGYVVARRTGLPLYLDLEFYGNTGCGKDIKGIDNRRFLLFDTFPDIADRYADRIATPGDLMLYRLFYTDRYYKRENSFSYVGEVFSPGPHYIGQYYNNSAYIHDYRDELVKCFRFNVSLDGQEQALADDISGSDSCFIHIRKGDFVGSVHDVCSNQYYIDAIHRMAEDHPQVKFYVFSNDEVFSRELCSAQPYHFVFIEGRNESSPIVDLYLMTQCKHAIISNSRFSWFAAYMQYGNGGTVIMPNRWKNGDGGDESGARAQQLEGWVMMHA